MQSYIEVDKEDLNTLNINCKCKRTVGKENTLVLIAVDIEGKNTQE